MASSTFDDIFASLRRILARHAQSLSVAEDSPKRYCLEGRVGPATLRAWGGKLKKTMIPVAWVEVGKAYVSFHLMGIYGNEKAREGMTQELRVRMRGKTCFNFKIADQALFHELEGLTERACEGFKKAGFIE
jgi:hypothetical protein